jgi:hypothetical protein
MTLLERDRATNRTKEPETAERRRRMKKQYKIRHGVLIGARGVGQDAEIGTWHKDSGCIAVRPCDGKKSNYLIHSAEEFRVNFRRKPGQRQIENIIAKGFDSLKFMRVIVAAR